MTDENKTGEDQTLQVNGEIAKNLYYCWLCGGELLGADICPCCGIPQ